MKKGIERRWLHRFLRYNESGVSMNGHRSALVLALSVFLIGANGNDGVITSLDDGVITSLPVGLTFEAIA